MSENGGYTPPGADRPLNNGPLRAQLLEPDRHAVEAGKSLFMRMQEQTNQARASQDQTPPPDQEIPFHADDVTWERTAAEQPGFIEQYDQSPQPSQPSSESGRQSEFVEAGQKLMTQLGEMEKLGGVPAEIAKQIKSIQPGTGFLSGVELSQLPRGGEREAPTNARVGLDGKGLITMQLDVDFLRTANPSQIQAGLSEEWRHVKDMQSIASREGKPRLMNERERVQSEVNARQVALATYSLARESGGIDQQLEPIYQKVQSINSQVETGALSRQTADIQVQDEILSRLQREGYSVQNQRDRDLMRSVSGEKPVRSPPTPEQKLPEPIQVEVQEPVNSSVPEASNEIELQSIELNERYNQGLKLREGWSPEGQHVMEVTLDTRLPIENTIRNADTAGNLAWTSIFPDRGAIPFQTRNALTSNVLYNLSEFLQNGVDAGRLKGEPEVKVMIVTSLTPDGQLDIQLKDDQTGFPDQVIKEYYADAQTEVLDSTKKGDDKMQGGKGIGVAQTRNHIEKGMNGSVNIGNAPEGGAVVDLRFPIDASYINARFKPTEVSDINTEAPIHQPAHQESSQTPSAAEQQLPHEKPSSPETTTSSVIRIELDNSDAQHPVEIIPLDWQQGKTIKVEIGPDTGIFQLSQMHKEDPEVLKNTVLVLIEQEVSSTLEKVANRLAAGYGGVIIIKGEGIDALAKLNIPANTIDLNNVLTQPGSTINLDRLSEVASRHLAPGGTLTARETNTPEVMGVYSESQIKDAFAQVGKMETTHDLTDPRFGQTGAIGSEGSFLVQVTKPAEDTRENAYRTSVSEVSNEWTDAENASAQVHEWVDQGGEVKVVIGPGNNAQMLLLEARGAIAENPAQRERLQSTQIVIVDIDPRIDNSDVNELKKIYGDVVLIKGDGASSLQSLPNGAISEIQIDNVFTESGSGLDPNIVATAAKNVLSEGGRIIIRDTYSPEGKGLINQQQIAKAFTGIGESQVARDPNNTLFGQFSELSPGAFAVEVVKHTKLEQGTDPLLKSLLESRQSTIQPESKPSILSSQLIREVGAIDTILKNIQLDPRVYNSTETKFDGSMGLRLEALSKHFRDTIPNGAILNGAAFNITNTFDTQYVVSRLGIEVVQTVEGSSPLMKVESSEYIGVNTDRTVLLCKAMLIYAQLYGHNAQELTVAMHQEVEQAMAHIRSQLPIEATVKPDAVAIVNPEIFIDLAPKELQDIAKTRLTELKKLSSTDATGHIELQENATEVVVSLESLALQDLKVVDGPVAVRFQKTAKEIKNILLANPNAQIQLASPDGAGDRLTIRVRGGQLQVDRQTQPTEARTSISHTHWESPLPQSGVATAELPDILNSLTPYIAEQTGQARLTGQSIIDEAENYQDEVSGLSESLAETQHTSAVRREQESGYSGTGRVERQDSERAAAARTSENKVVDSRLTKDEIKQRDKVNYAISSPEANFRDPKSEVQVPATGRQEVSERKPGLIDRAKGAVRRSHGRAAGLTDEQMIGLPVDQQKALISQAQEGIQAQRDTVIEDSLEAEKAKNITDAYNDELNRVRADIKAIGGDPNIIVNGMNADQLKAAKEHATAKASQAHTQEKAAKKTNGIALATGINSGETYESSVPAQSPEQPRIPQPQERPNTGRLETAVGALATAVTGKRGADTDYPPPESTDQNNQPEQSNSPPAEQPVTPSQPRQTSAPQQPQTYEDYDYSQGQSLQPRVEYKADEQAPPPPPHVEPKYDFDEELFNTGPRVTSPTLKSLQEKYERVSDLGEQISETSPDDAQLIAGQLERIQQDMIREYAKQQASDKTK